MALGEDERLVYEAVRRNNGASVDVISSETGHSPALTSSLVTVLEVKGVLETYGGKIYLAN